MTNIAFYLQQNSSQKSLEQIVCQLVQKAYIQDNFIYIQTQNIEQANLIDDLLWSIQDDSFIPHLNMSNIEKQVNNHSLVELTQEQQKLSKAYHVPVIINTATSQIDIDLNPKRKEELLINLNDEIPFSFSRFHRLAEIISNNEEVKKVARVRYKFYKDRGYPILTHDIN